MISSRVPEAFTGPLSRAQIWALQIWALIVATVSLVGGCSHGQLVPAASAHLIPGAPTAAFDEQEGVRVSVNGDAWRGAPADLAKRLTPVKVRLINHSGKPLQILYERFTMWGANGRRYRPLPVVPLDHDGARATPLTPIFANANFFVGPRYRDVYPSLESWSEPLQRDEAFYQHQYQLWGEGLPTTQMQRSALPEGVLGEGGEMSGYLYFENATRDEDHLKFRAELDEARGVDVVATIEVPFRVE